jgi:hypothetical protein
MGVLTYREIVPRSFTHRFGESPTAEIRYHATTDGPTPTQTVLATIGIFHGTPHPEYGYLLCTEGNLNELDRFHVEVVYRYEVPATGTEDSDPNPLARADVWSFSTGGAAVPALAYYEGSGNGNVRALVNSAFDFFEGAMTEESELRATITGNRALFPVGVATSVTNAVNSDAYLGAAIYQWKCQGISAQQQVEVVNGAEIKYWSVSVELAYRQSGWRLMLPDIGWNYLEGGEKERAYVKSPPPESENVASANPVALNSNGSLKSPGTAPNILYRRVHKEVAFVPLFGTPPF